ALTGTPGWPPPLDPGTTPGRPPARKRRRRAPVHIPPGTQAEDPRAVEAMVRTADVVVVVDGYNLTMAAWPAAAPAEQRTRLVDALAELHLRARCRIVVVFDGADVEGVPPPRRRGLTVVFSPAHTEADDVVVAQVGALPMPVPVLVVSSDASVRHQAEARGATVVASGRFLPLLRR
ncbi:MAG: NYN domain-containing protein, partial [Acidimicrobiia bacterium]